LVVVISSSRYGGSTDLENRDCSSIGETCHIRLVLSTSWLHPAHEKERGGLQLDWPSRRLVFAHLRLRAEKSMRNQKLAQPLARGSDVIFRRSVRAGANLD